MELADCSMCKLCHNTEKPCLMGRGPKGAKIMMIQDAPSQLESTKSKQFFGKIYNSFMVALERRDIDLADIYFTSVVKCPLAEDGGDLTMAMTRECIAYLNAEIKAVDPDIIVPMGNQALKATYGKTGITKFRGNAIEVELEGRNRIVLPVIHPRQAVRKPAYKDLILKDLDTLADCYENGMNEVTGVDYHIIEDKKTALQWVERLSQAEWLCFDLETTGKSAFLDTSKIVCISLTDKPHTGCVIPLYHHESPIIGGDRDEVVAALKKLLEDPATKKVAHNGKFDIEWLKYWLHIEVANFCFDTMLAHYLAVSEEQGTQGLKGLAWEFTDMGGYDNELDEFRNKLPEAIRYNYDNIPWKILSKYAVADVDCCLRLKEIFMPLIEENPKWELLMREFLMPASYALMDVEGAGMMMDEDVIERYAQSYGQELARIKDRLASFPEVTQLERMRREKWEEREALKLIPKKDRTPEEQAKFEAYNKYKKWQFNWNSTTQLRELLFDKLGLTTEVTTDKGEPSTNEDALNEMAEQHEIPKLMLELRKIDTLNNMFIKKLPDMRGSDGIVHPSFNLSGTVTGRMSSENPNAQQFPRKTGDIFAFQYHNEPKALFNTRYGSNGCILQFDYSQLEIRIAGIISGDKQLYEVYHSGQDLHKATASLVWHVPVEEVSGDMRSNAKAVNFGIIYGKSGVTFAKDLFFGEGEGKTTDWDEARAMGLKLVDDYLNTFSGLNKWLKDTKKFAYKHGYVETMFGRRRRLPDLHSSIQTLKNNAERQAINAPIQGTGSDMTLRSIILIQQYLNKNRMKTKMICTVHDSIVFDVWLPELQDVFNFVKTTMESVHKPFIDTDVPIVAEAELGDAYGSIYEIAKIDDLVTPQDYFDWLHEQKIAKYVKEIKGCKKAGYDIKATLAYLQQYGRPILELKDKFIEIYSED